MSLTPEQQEMRRTGIGGSEVAAILGLNPYIGPIDVYLAKTEGWSQEETSAMERGTFLEPGLANWYAHRTGAELREVGTVRHPRIEVSLCTPDRLVRVPDGPWRDLSIKAPGPGSREEWGDPWTDEVPQGYLIQLQYELAVLGARDLCATDTADLAAGPLDGDLRIYTLTGDPELQGMLLEAVQRWWRDHVIARKPPPIDGSDTWDSWLLKRFPKHRAPLLQATPEDEVLAAEMEEAARMLKAAEVREAAACQRLKERIGEAEGLAGGAWRVTWKANKKGVRSLRVPTTWRAV